MFIQLAKWAYSNRRIACVSLKSKLADFLKSEVIPKESNTIEQACQSIVSLSSDAEKCIAIQALLPGIKYVAIRNFEQSISLVFDALKSCRAHTDLGDLYVMLIQEYTLALCGNIKFFSDILDEAVKRSLSHQFFIKFLIELIQFVQKAPIERLNDGISILKRVTEESLHIENGKVDLLEQLGKTMIKFAELEEQVKTEKLLNLNYLLPLITDISQRSLCSMSKILPDLLIDWMKIRKEAINFQILDFQVDTKEFVKTSQIVVTVVLMYSDLYNNKLQGTQLETDVISAEGLTGLPSEIRGYKIPQDLDGQTYLALRAVNRPFASLLWGPLTQMLAWTNGLVLSKENLLISQLKQDLKALPSPSVFSNQVLSIL